MALLCLLWLNSGCVLSAPGGTGEGTEPPDSGDEADDDDSGSDTDPVQLPLFALEVSTEINGDSIALRSNLPLDSAACKALQFREVPCDDLDNDGLVDAWEDLSLDRLRPGISYDESEQLFGDLGSVLHAVGRVAYAPGGSGHIRMYIMIGYSKDYGRCELSAHDGDSERVVLDLMPLDGATRGDVLVHRTYSAAHEGTAIDHGMILEGDELAQAEFPLDQDSGEPRWLVYASDGKHATYQSITACENAEALPCLDEDCAPDNVDDPAAYHLLPPIVNAGEESAPRLNDLTEIGFPDEDAWLEQPFCGGQGRGSNCSASIREKLLVDPFDPSP